MPSMQVPSIQARPRGTTRSWQPPTALNAKCLHSDAAGREAPEPGCAGPGPPRIRESAAGARRMRAMRVRRLAERPESVADAAFALRDGAGKRL